MSEEKKKTLRHPKKTKRILGAAAIETRCENAPRVFE